MKTKPQKTFFSESLKLFVDLSPEEKAVLRARQVAAATNAWRAAVYNGFSHNVCVRKSRQAAADAKKQFLAEL